jgi:hypothetical protein
MPAAPRLLLHRRVVDIDSTGLAAVEDGMFFTRLFATV